MHNIGAEGGLTPGIQVVKWELHSFYTREEAEAWLEEHRDSLEIYVTPEGKQIQIFGEKPFNIFARERGE